MKLSITEQSIINQLRSAKSGRLSIRTDDKRNIAACKKLISKGLLNLVEKTFDWEWATTKYGTPYKKQNCYYLVELNKDN